MDRINLSKKLGVKKLEDYIIDEFNFGKTEAEILLNNHFEKSIADIEKIENEEVKKIAILSELIKIKNEFNKIKENDFFYILKEAKQYGLNFIIKSKTDYDELNNLAKFILDYYDFKATLIYIVENELKRTRENSRMYHLVSGFISLSKAYFDILNEINKIDDFNWDWANFEKGLIKVLANHSLEMISIKSDCKLEIDLFKSRTIREYENEIESLKDQIKYLNLEIKHNKEELKFNSDYYDKYYKEIPIVFKETYFGDNLPFITELYKFLKKCNLFKYGFSYFYSCLLINNNELINLNSDKKNNFIGRILYRLSDFLIKDYKDNSFMFFQSKFFINDQPISDNFKTNHMKIKYDKNIDNELLDIDNFFDKLSKIYIKY